MVIKRTKSLGLALVTGLTPLVISATPVLASTAPNPTANTGQTTSMAAQSIQPGMSASTASAPIAGWLQIAPHSSQWFRFKYHYANTAEHHHDEDNPPTQAVIKLMMQSPGSVNFEVWTPDRLRNLQYDQSDTHHRNGKLEPVGMGTPMFAGETHHRDADGTRDTIQETNPDVLIWAGSERASDTFYVVVKNTTDAAASYALTVSGPDVSY
jgi:hypothetical protein